MSLQDQKLVARFSSMANSVARRLIGVHDRDPEAHADVAAAANTYTDSELAAHNADPDAHAGILSATAAGAKLYATGSQVCATGIGTQVTFWDSTGWDEGGFWSPGNPGVLTVPAGQAGTYLLTCHVSFDDAGNFDQFAGFFINGAEHLPGRQRITSPFAVTSTTTVLQLAEGDQASAFAFQASGGNKSLLGPRCEFSITKLD